MERGAALLPGDGSAWDRLGRMRQWDFMNSDLPGAIEDYWRAVGDDPRSAHFWMDSGERVREFRMTMRARAMHTCGLNRCIRPPPRSRFITEIICCASNSTPKRC